MVQFYFEIFRQTFDRWSWRFVVVRDGERRVLARSGPDFRSRRRARRAIRRLRRAVRGAPVVVVSGSTGQDGFPLPTSSFAFVPGVVPLVVRGSAGELEPAGALQPVSTGGGPLAELPARNGEPVQAREQAAQPQVQQEPAEAATPEPPAAPEPEQKPEPEKKPEKKPTARRGSRRARTT